MRRQLSANGYGNPWRTTSREASRSTPCAGSSSLTSSYSSDSVSRMTPSRSNSSAAVPSGTRRREAMITAPKISARAMTRSALRRLPVRADVQRPLLLRGRIRSEERIAQHPPAAYQSSGDVPLQEEVRQGLLEGAWVVGIGGSDVI